MSNLIFLGKSTGDEVDLCYKPALQCLLFFEMNSRQENRSKLSFYNQRTFSFYLRSENV